MASHSAALKFDPDRLAVFGGSGGGGLAAGTVLAALSARFRRVEELLAPAMLAIKSIPVASFIILALILMTMPIDGPVDVRWMAGAIGRHIHDPYDLYEKAAS